jgi:uncharacterized membrane protein HdeD (DUF308 family)
MTLQDKPISRGGLAVFLGIVLVLAGGTAIGLPLAKTVAIDHLIGVVLLVAGAAYGLYAAGSRGSEWTLRRHLLGILALAAGLTALFYPLGEKITLMHLLAGYFIIDGAFKVGSVVRMRPARWGGEVLSGAVSWAAGVLFAIDILEHQFWIIGLMFGVPVVCAGLAMMLTGAGQRKTARLAAS